MATVYLGLVALINEFGLGRRSSLQRDLGEHDRQITTLCVLLGLAGFVISVRRGRSSVGVLLRAGASLGHHGDEPARS